MLNEVVWLAHVAILLQRAVADDPIKWPSWMLNSRNQNPLEMAKYAMSPCNDGVPLELKDAISDWKTGSEIASSDCFCSSITYSLASAWLSYVPHPYNISWGDWTSYCARSNILNGSYPFQTPAGTNFPSWASIPVTSYWNSAEAQGQAMPVSSVVESSTPASDTSASIGTFRTPASSSSYLPKTASKTASLGSAELSSASDTYSGSSPASGHQTQPLSSLTWSFSPGQSEIPSAQSPANSTGSAQVAWVFRTVRIWGQSWAELLEA
ncbi:hypothetical protein B0H21DRAFT_93930 [Amylocystis lapponica]|nr:hypothetical protein B0H21DRAFT_93930 [Amylocystis lapponica]